MYIFTQSQIGNYADDNTLYVIAKSVDELVETLSSETKVAIEWFNQNDMQANPDKFQLIYFGKNPEQRNISFGNFELKPSKSVTLLGVQVDSSLSFTEHVSNIVKKGARAMYALKRIGSYIDADCGLTLLRCYILSHMMYCCVAWHFTYKKNAQAIDKIQERGLRYVFKDFTSTYDELLSRADLPLLETARKRTVVTTVYKILNGLSPVYLSDLFHSANIQYNLRNNSGKLVLARKNTELWGIRSFQYQGARTWNSISSDLKSCNELSTFKKRLSSVSL